MQKKKKKKSVRNVSGPLQTSLDLSEPLLSVTVYFYWKLTITVETGLTFLASPSSHPSLRPGLIIIPDSLPPLLHQHRRMAMGVAVNHMFSLLPLLPLGKDSSHSSTVPVWGPFRRRQSFINFSSTFMCHGFHIITRMMKPVVVSSLALNYACLTKTCGLYWSALFFLCFYCLVY